MTVQQLQQQQPHPSFGARLASRLRLVWTLATTNGVIKRSLIVAAVVGTILTLINQGDKIFSGHQPLWWKVGLTYCVPFCVATYGAVTARLATYAPPSADDCAPESRAVALHLVVDANSQRGIRADSSQRGIYADNSQRAIRADNSQRGIRADSQLPV